MTNKKLLAVAVAAALAAPGLALAQATTTGTNVQIYGLFDQRLSQDKFSKNTAGTINELKKYNMHGWTPNRIGFRGTEGLGAGMTAFFQVETQVFTDARPDTGNNNATNAVLGGRPSFVGLRTTAWGEVSLGYQDSVYKDAFGVWSVVPTQGHFGIIMGAGNSTGAIPSPNCAAQNPSGVNSPVNVTAAGTAGQICSETPANGISFNRTVSNSVVYRSPVIAGVRFATILATNEFKEPSNATPAGSAQYNPSFSAYSLAWSGGPFSVIGAYERHNAFRAINTVGANRSVKDDGITLGGRWNYGRGLIGAGWERIKYGNAAATAATANEFTIQNYVVNGTFNVTPADVIAAGYSRTPGRKSCGAGLTSAANTCGDPTSSKMWALSYDHNFSKRTAVYAVYSKIDNNAGANYYYIAGPKSNSNLGVTGGLAAGVDATTLGVGVKHTF